MATAGLRLDLHNHTTFSPDGLLTPAALAQMAASLKRKVKEITTASRNSGFLFERRRLRPTT